MVMIRPRGKTGKLAEQVVPALKEKKSQMGDFKEMLAQMPEIISNLEELNALQVQETESLPFREQAQGGQEIHQGF